MPVQPWKTGNVSADPRGSAITRSSRTMLQTLGVWDAVADQAQPFEKIIVTDGRNCHRRRDRHC